VLVVLAAVFAGVELARPAPDLVLSASLPARSAVPGRPLSLPWPTMGTAALAVQGVGLVGSSGGEVAVPLASVTKMMTAYVVLHDHPLNGGVGPTLTVAPADVADYQRRLADQESVVAVQAGETLTERQALEGLLLPSGNNIADLLAEWDAGSVGAFVAKMNATASELGLDHTHYAGPSGLNPASVGTATEQVRLAELAMRDPDFAAIVAEPQASLPVAGTVYNVNGLVGHDGIVGVKTGSTPETGSDLVFAADRTVSGRPVVLFGAVLGQKGSNPMATTFAETESLLSALTAQLRPVTVVKKGGMAGAVRTAWGAEVPAVTTANASFLGWSGMTLQAEVRARRLGSQVTQGESVGAVRLGLGDQEATVGLVAGRTAPSPPWSWRLRRL
jgi:D-alanyl-D-alanine carboxypeptidase (penicillin-binding protein 5/6)